VPYVQTVAKPPIDLARISAISEFPRLSEVSTIVQTAVRSMA
jgi:hypothetical protein